MATSTILLNQLQKTKDIMNTEDYIEFESKNYSEEEIERRSLEFLEDLRKRRSVRNFAEREVSKEVIDNLIKTAGLAPSGANKQPWTFCVISNKQLKKEIRRLAEIEEYENYHVRMSDSWKQDLKHLGTNYIKEFLDIAPYLIVVFKKVYDVDKDGDRAQNYYVNESVGIACGFLIAAIHQAGLVTLTHTPSPMTFLQKALNRPKNEKAFLLLPVGYPAENCKVPNIQKKQFDEICHWHD